MYEQHFQLTENPFTIAPNPHYLYLSEQHREALAHLSYGLKEKNGSFILLTGEVGTGKTTVCRCLVEQVPEDVYLAVILNPRLSEAELLQTICSEFGIEHDKNGTIKTLIDTLNTWLLQVHGEGKHAAIIVEEAQNLDDGVLEQLRLLTNLETNERKLLQIILIGQPELLEKLERPELRQLSQRIIARYHLTALNYKEIRAYIIHRLKVAHGNPTIFPPSVILRIAQLSKGIPRLINLLCDRALLGCYVQDKHEVSIKIVEQAAAEVFGKHKWSSLKVRSRKFRWASLATAVVLSGAAYFVAVMFYPSVYAFFYPPTTLSTALSVEEPVLQMQAPESPDLLEPPAETISPTSSPQEENIQLTWESLANGDFRESEAYRALFKNWQLDVAPSDGRTPCEFASDHGLDCWHKRGEFIDIQRVNRPVLLKLVSVQGQPFYVALLSVSGNNRWQIGVRESMIIVPKIRIESFWTGEYTVLWRRPDNYIRTIRPGDKSQLVTWLSNQFALIDGRKVSGNQLPLVYDVSLMAKVRQFQRRCALQVDGLLGKETIIMLNTVNSDVPVLLAKQSSNCPRKFNS